MCSLKCYFKTIGPMTLIFDTTVDRDKNSKDIPSIMAIFREQSLQFGSQLDPNQGSSLRSNQAEGRRPEFVIYVMDVRKKIQISLTSHKV